jgi:hypothetical protein
MTSTATKICDHCGTPASKRYAVRITKSGRSRVAMVGSSCAKRVPRARISDLIRATARDTATSGAVVTEPTEIRYTVPQSVRDMIASYPAMQLSIFGTFVDLEKHEQHLVGNASASDLDWLIKRAYQQCRSYDRFLVTLDIDSQFRSENIIASVEDFRVDFKIVVSRQRPEERHVVQETQSYKEAVKLADQYRLGLGPGWVVSIEPFAITEVLEAGMTVPDQAVSADEAASTPRPLPNVRYEIPREVKLRIASIQAHTGRQHPFHLEGRPGGASMDDLTTISIARMDAAVRMAASYLDDGTYDKIVISYGIYEIAAVELLRWEFNVVASRDAGKESYTVMSVSPPPGQIYPSKNDILEAKDVAEDIRRKLGRGWTVSAKQTLVLAVTPIGN